MRKEESIVTPRETLGGYLGRLRREQHKKIEDMAEETKISRQKLLAMEADDYGALPAAAFARGLYGIYAKALRCDQAEVLRRYEEEVSGNTNKKLSDATTVLQDKQIGTMAARPSRTLWARTGLVLFVIIIVGTLSAWYFSWNPATFISEKLQNMQAGVESEEETSESSSLFPTDPDGAVQSENTRYFLTVEFLRETTFTAKVDDAPPEKNTYAEGSTCSWYANTSISLILPEDAQVVAYQSGSRINLPKANTKGEIVIKIP